MSDAISTTLAQISALPVDDQLELLHQAWDRLHESGWQPELTPELVAELDRRIDDADKDPDTGMTLDQLKAYVRRPR